MIVQSSSSCRPARQDGAEPDPCAMKTPSTCHMVGDRNNWHICTMHGKHKPPLKRDEGPIIDCIAV